ncbi:MAG: PQQ-binding-like beta-propeller repeat protein, partial [Candidatus Hermodarchaeota archaeon]
MKKKSKFFIILSICTMFSITILAVNIPQNTIRISSEKNNSVISLSTPKVSVEGEVTSLWNYTFSNIPRRVAISGDGYYIMVINESTATFFHRNSNSTLWSYALGAQINNEAMSFNGNYVVLVDNDNNVTLLDSISKTELWNFDDFSGCTSAYIDISDDGNYIAVANRSGGVYLFDNEPSAGQKQPKWFYDDGTSKDYRDVAISGN